MMSSLAIFVTVALAALAVAWVVNALVSILSGEHPHDTGRLWLDSLFRIFSVAELGWIGRILNFTHLGTPPKITTVRATAFAVLAISSLVLIAIAQRGPIYRSGSGSVYPQYGVSLFWKGSIVQVKVDEREENVPIDQATRSPIFLEAMARIPRESRPAVTEVRWGRVCGVWIPLVTLTWWLLFRVGQSRRAYIDGGASL